MWAPNFSADARSPLICLALLGVPLGDRANGPAVALRNRKNAGALRFSCGGPKSAADLGAANETLRSGKGGLKDYVSPVKVVLSF